MIGMFFEFGVLFYGFYTSLNNKYIWTVVDFPTIQRLVGIPKYRMVRISIEQRCNVGSIGQKFMEQKENN
jgi:hypothetical protein